MGVARYSRNYSGCQVLVQGQVQVLELIYSLTLFRVYLAITKLWNICLFKNYRVKESGQKNSLWELLRGLGSIWIFPLCVVHCALEHWSCASPGWYGSKISKSRRTFKLRDQFKSYNNFTKVFFVHGLFLSGTSLLWIMGESAGEGQPGPEGWVSRWNL